jgi:hypothetical protein
MSGWSSYHLDFTPEPADANTDPYIWAEEAALRAASSPPRKAIGPSGSRPFALRIGSADLILVS